MITAAAYAPAAPPAPLARRPTHLTRRLLRKATGAPGAPALRSVTRIECRRILAATGPGCAITPCAALRERCSLRSPVQPPRASKAAPRGQRLRARRVSRPLRTTARAPCARYARRSPAGDGGLCDARPLTAVRPEEEDARAEVQCCALVPTPGEDGEGDMIIRMPFTVCANIGLRPIFAQTAGQESLSKGSLYFRF